MRLLSFLLVKASLSMKDIYNYCKKNNGHRIQYNKKLYCVITIFSYKVECL